MKIKAIPLMLSCSFLLSTSILTASQNIQDFDEAIGVIGSGPAGAYAARKLKDAGYTNVHILEMSDQVGGKCFTHSAPSGEYDLGAVQTASDYDIVNSLCVRFGLHQINSAPNVYIDKNGTRYDTLPSQYSFARRMLAFGAYALSGTLNSSSSASYKNIGTNPVLRQDLETFLSTYTLEPMKEFLNVGLRIYGYGNFEDKKFDDILVAHAFKYISPRLVRDMVIDQIPIIRHLLPRPPIMSIQEGFQELVKRMTQDLDVQLNKKVTSIETAEAGLRVTCDDNSAFHFSRVIVASPPQSIDFNTVLGVDPTQLFNKIHYNSYGTTLFETPSDVIDGDQLMVDFEGTEPAGVLEKYPDTNLYMSYAYKQPTADSSVVVPPLEDFVQSQFGSQIAVKSQFFTNYYPRPSITDAPSYYAEIEALQGSNGVYFTGSHLSFENVNQAMQHAGEIVDAHFLPTPQSRTLSQRLWDFTLGRFV